jgi:hypothetical protein
MIALVSIAALGLGIALFRAHYFDTDITTNSDSSYYASMVSHEWLSTAGLMPWSIRQVPVPFQYRVLVPWLARAIPLDPITSLSAVTLISLSLAYAFLLVMLGRVNLSMPAAIGGLAAAYASVSSVGVYGNLVLTDGFGLMIICAMLYALVADRFWVFALFGLMGPFAREITLIVLPLWCLRNARQGLWLAGIGIGAFMAQRAVMPGGGDTLADAFLTYGTGRVREPRLLLVPVLNSWGWAFALLPVGLVLFGRKTFIQLVAALFLLLASAFATSMIAADIGRMFIILFPVVGAAAARLLESLIAGKHRVWVCLFAVLVTVQLCVSAPNTLLGDRIWEIAATRIPILKLGMLWTIGAIILLRRELVEAMAQKWGAVPEPSCQG